jgi:DNA-binding LacI/PurR family transcriptional regulator
MNSTERLKRAKAQMEEGNFSGPPKYAQIYECVVSSLKSGEYRQGSRLPSETELVRRFGVSRMTIVRALNDLERDGYVVRKAGSGTYAAINEENELRHFGLLIPGLGETEIFEPICQGLASFPFATKHALLWGNMPVGEAGQAEAAEQLCHDYIQQKVSGVFFAPLELTARKDQVNQRIVTALDRAKIAVVLLDRCIMPYPLRSNCDLVGVASKHSSYIATRHLISLGAKRIAFVGKVYSAPTVDARIAGYREALFDHDLLKDEDLVARGNPSDERWVRSMLEEMHPDAIFCANDLTAAKLMHTLLGLGVKIPEEVRLVGFDDVKYASLLPIQLTSMRQPCADIGRAAMAAMLERLANPEAAPRDVFLHCQLIVRQSCGAHMADNLE